ncbi:MAG: hypothetical protein HC896_00250 [Bacteroidales bacterium]|nr:hypothetical protein [Bacteroidales bacterium]
MVSVFGCLLPLPWTAANYQLPNEPAMTITSSKTIIETALAGNTRRGMVKEIINADDYKITLEGICTDDQKRGYPADQVEMLKDLDNYEGTLQIKSYLTELFEINNVIIKSLSLRPAPGMPYMQPFSIELVSDEDFILIKN